MDTLSINIIDLDSKEFLKRLESKDFKFLPRTDEFIELIGDDSKSKHYKVKGIYHSISKPCDGVCINIYVKEVA